MTLRQILFACCLLTLAVTGGSRVFANVDLLYFRAESSSDTITLIWETETELDNLGFHLWRSQTGNQADAVRINAALIPSQVGGQPIGALYEFVDSNVQDQMTYTYWLESVDMNGNSEFHAPIQAALGGGSPIITPPPGGGNPTEPTRTNTPPATTATTIPSIPGSSEPTATGLSPTSTIAPISTSPTVPPTPATNNNPTTGGAPPTTISQPTESFVPADTGQSDTGEESPADISAITPLASPDSDLPAVADNEAAPVVKPTATYIDGENITTIGQQDPAVPAGDETNPAEDAQPTNNRMQTIAIFTLIIGVLLTAIGGVALWSLSRPKTDSR